MSDRMTAARICTKAAELVSGERATQHGDKIMNMENIARFWDAYLQSRYLSEMRLGTRGYGPCPVNVLSSEDVANMMELLKIARRLTGNVNMDDAIDAAGYAGIWGELALDDAF